MPNSPLVIRLFGPLRVVVRGAPMPRVRSRSVEWLLALLALRPGCAVEREWLAGTLWPESDADTARRTLRSSLMHLRRALGPESERLRSPTRDRLTLDLEDADVDLARFDALVRSTRAADWQAATELYAGPLLEGCHEEWVLADRTLRATACLEALDRLADAAAGRAEYRPALVYLRRAEALDPLRDETQRRLLRALAAGGETAAAVLSYREYRLRLHRELNAAPDAETTRLFREIREKAKEGGGALGHWGVEEQAPNPPMSQRPDAVVPTPRFVLPPGAAPPLPLTALIGREEEVRQVAAGVRSARLVTLVGGGGVGKTRLAIEVTARVAGEFADGVAFVPLASLADPALLPSFVAATLGLREEGRAGAGALTDRLAAAALLLVLDNCEHLIDAAAELAQTLLERCPRLQILATSRQRLALAGEVLWRVPSLAAPDPEQVPPAAPAAAAFVMAFPAVQLLAERAAQVRPGFRLARLEDTRAAVRVCRCLDGIPLAIELAAARLAALNLPQIAERLADRFHLLAGGKRGVLPRHQTLRTLVDWSYELLDEAERTLLRRLSVFAGGWTLEAAEAVAAAPLKDEDGRMRDEGDWSRAEAAIYPPSSFRLHPPEVLPLLARLVDHSLVAYQEGEGAGRYYFLETIREYAREKLKASGEETELRERHREYFAALAEMAYPELVGPDQVAWLGRLQAELENLRAALAFCRETPGGVEAGLRLGASLWRFWAARGYLQEGCDHLQTALARDTARLASAPSLAENPHWRRLRARALVGAVAITSDLLEPETVEQLAQEALRHWQALSDARGIASSLTSIGNLRMQQDRIPEARVYFQQVLDLVRETGDGRGCGVALNNLAATLGKDEHETARDHFRQALAIARELGDRRSEALYLSNLGEVALQLGNVAEARELHREALCLRSRDGGGLALAMSLEAVGVVAIAEGRYRRGACLCAASRALRHRLAAALHYSGSETAESCLARAAQALGEAGYAAALQEGRQMPLERAVEYALAEECDAPASLPGATS